MKSKIISHRQLQNIYNVSFYHITKAYQYLSQLPIKICMIKQHPYFQLKSSAHVPNKFDIHIIIIISQHMLYQF